MPAQVAGHDACEAALRASEDRFRNVIERNADGMVVVGPGGEIVYVNPAAESLLGLPRDRLLGSPFGRPIVPGETVELDLLCGGRDPCVAEMRVVETEWDGAPAALASLRDVTDRKRLEDELGRRVEELAEADRQKNLFLAMLAHELRNPLAPARNAAEVLKLRAGDPETLAWAGGLIARQVDHLTRLVDDLLDVSRITRGTVDLRREAIALAPLVRAAAEAMRPAIEANGQHLELAIADDGARVDADATRIEQVVSNLLHNASKFTEAGGHIRVTLARAGDRAEVAVADDGIGIAPAMLGRVFDLFAQVDTQLDRARGGLGIGLTLVRSLVELHGGSVRAESAGEGLGSRFVVSLPTLPDAAGVEAPAPPPRPGSTVSRSVLVVDDNVYAAESLALLLRLWGHESALAFDGAEALEVADSVRPDVILLDIGLPVLDGFAVAERLRATEKYAHVLLIALTGYGHADARQKARAAGFDLHLIKPVNLDDLRDILARPGPVRPGVGLEGPPQPGGASEKSTTIGR